jgi:nicotinate phosphoribosyltransferase
MFPVEHLPVLHICPLLADLLPLRNSSVRLCYGALIMSEFSPRPLLTDLYELTMAAAYFESGIDAAASFEMMVRKLPENRGYLLAAGLEQVLDFLEGFRFRDDEIKFLRRHPVFERISDSFFEYLRNLRFTGEVWAIPEGTPVFPQEPLLRVTAPIVQAQIVETYLLAEINFQTLIATKAARMVQAAAGRSVVEFGTRRAHGPEAGVLAARAAFIGGCVGTSNVETGFRFGVPTFGTVAHSFIMAFDDELEAFRRMEQCFPEDSVLLVDTYDTLAAIDKIIAAGLRPRAVRLDSGDMVALSKDVRRRLDDAGLNQTRIFISGDLNELRIEEYLAQGAAVDVLGVGTQLATSQDAPALGGVYKLVELVREGKTLYRLKLSEHKPSYPGRKQVFRFDSGGQNAYDVISLHDETSDGEPLLECVMRHGKRLRAAPAIAELQGRARELVARVPEPCRALRNPAEYPVSFSRKLEDLAGQEASRVMAKFGSKPDQ